MPYIVELPDGREVEFPDSVSREEASRIIREQVYAPSTKEPERTIGGYAKEALKGLIPGAAGMAETAITGAAALLPEEAEQAVRRGVSGFVEPIREAFAPAPGYEDTTVRKLSEAVGSTAPFLGVGLLGAAGRAAAVGLGGATGAGEARQRAEEETATEGERAVATALGIGPGLLEAYAPIQILRRLGFGDEAVKEVAGFIPALRRAAQAGGEEALMEASGQVLQNLIEKGVYNPEEAALGGVGEAAALGGGAGAIVSALADLALGRRLRGAAPEEAPPEEPAGALTSRMQEQREEQFLSGTEEAFRKAALDEDAAAAAKDDLSYLRSLPMEQMGLALEGGEAAPETVLPPAAEPRPQMFVSGEEALAKAIEQRELDTGEEVRPRSRAYREEAKDLGVRLDRKGEVKPNQAVFEQPETEVPAEQMGFNLPGVPMARLAPADRVLRAMAITEIEQPKTKAVLQEATGLKPAELSGALFTLKGQGAIAFNPKSKEWELTPAGVESVRSGPEVKPARRGRGPRVSVPPQGPAGPAISETGTAGLAGVSPVATGTDVREGAVGTALKPEELLENIKSRLSFLRNENQGRVPAVGSKQRTEYESVYDQYFEIQKIVLKDRATNLYKSNNLSTPEYNEIVEELNKPIPEFSYIEEKLVTKPKSISAAPTAPTPPVDRMAVIRRAAEQRAARQAIDEVSRRKSELSSRAIDAFDADEINEKTYTAITDELKKPVPNFARVTSLLEGTAKPKRERDVGLKFQRGKVPAVPKVTPEQASAVATNAIRGWTNPPKVVVARDAADPAISEQYRSQIPDDAKGFYIDGTTYVLADRATDEAGIRATVFHESLGHYGLEQEFRDGLNEQMLALYNGNRAVRAAADARMAKDDSLDKATAVEEVLASRAEAGPIKDGGIRSAFNRIAAWIRNWLRSRKLMSSYSDNDVTQILRRAQERVINLKKAPYNPFDSRVRYQRSPEEQRKGDIKFINSIGQIPEKLPAATKETLEDARNAASKLPPATRRALFEFYNAHDMDRIYGFAPGGNKITKGYAKLWSALNEEGAYLFKLKAQITDNYQAWDKVLNKYSPAERDRIYNLFMDTTVEQVEVLDFVDKSRNIEWIADKKSPIYTEFQKLSPEVKEVYKGLRLAYMDYSLAVENALKQYLTPTEWQKLQNKFNERRLKVYLPLYRTGDFKLRYVDKNGDTVALQFETPRERAIAKQEAIRQGIPANEIIESKVGTQQEAQVPPSAFFADVVGRMTKAKVDPAVVNSVVEAYLDLLPAKSVLQLSRKRQRDAKGRGIKGFSNNVLEAYANIGSSYANRVANITYGNKFNEAQMEIKGDLSKAVDKGKLNPDVAEDLNSALSNQMQFIREPNLGGVGAKASYASFHLFLGANLSTAIVNVFDVVTISLNRLGGRYKFGPAMRELTKAATYSSSKPVRNDAERAERDEMEKLIQLGTDSGALRVQQLSDLAEFKDMDSKYARIKAGTERISNWAFAKSDMFNRQTTFMAAYNLSKAKRGKVPAGQIDPEAVADAERAVYDVYGSSFPKAAIPIMRNDFARVALTFKTFGIRRLQLLGNALREAGKGESKEVRDAARNEIIGYFGTAFLFAGVQGMPVVGAGLALVSVLNGIFGDDDEPYNPEFKFREAIGLFNYKGPVNYLLGIDIASRTGWTGMFWREDPKRMAEVGPATYVLEQLMGPAYAYGAGLIKDGGALDNIFIEGKFQQGFEQLLPRALANPMKAYRYAEEGARTASGMPLVDDVNAYNQFMQIFGFRPSEVAEAGEEAGAAKRMESKIRQRRNAIIDRAAVAHISGDYDAYRQAFREAIEFSRKNPTVQITPEVLMGAVERRKKKVLQSVNGVTVDPKLATDIYSELGINPYE